MEFAARMFGGTPQTGRPGCSTCRVRSSATRLRPAAPDGRRRLRPSGARAFQVVLAAGNYGISGYFDMWHRIDFVGRPGGALSGLSGSTTRQRRFEMCPGGVVGDESSSWSNLKALYR